jgi:methionine-rich copper-binding protein CopC
VTPGPTASAEVSPPAVRLPVYYAGTVGGKSVLYREFHDASPATSAELPGRVAEAVRIVLTDRPFDPDYTTSWPAGVGVGGVTFAGGVAAIDLTGPAATVAPIAIQQLVWTATAVAADRGVQLDGVRLWLGGTQLGGGVLTRAPALDTLAPAWLISPQEGDTVSTRFDVHVSGAVPGGRVGLRVLNPAGTVVYETTITLSAQAPNRGEAHSSVDLPPGTYTLELHALTAADTHHITVK